jgi:NAD(P)H-dependent flavin oxidoreductase YrpB (nitropropane dioxygenase family)
MQGQVSRRNGVMGYTGLDCEDADPSRTFMPTGQGAGLIGEIKPAAQVFTDVLRETEAALRGAQGLLADKSATQHSAAR